QGGMIEKLSERLSTIARVHGRVHQFAQVLNARVSFGRVFLFQLFDVSRAIDQKFENLSSIRLRARSTETLYRYIYRLISQVVDGATGVLARHFVLRRIASRKIKAEVAR